MIDLSRTSILNTILKTLYAFPENQYVTVQQLHNIIGLSSRPNSIIKKSSDAMQMGLMEKEKRGSYRLSKKGRELLKTYFEYAKEEQKPTSKNIQVPQKEMTKAFNNFAEELASESKKRDLLKPAPISSKLTTVILNIGDLHWGSKTDYGYGIERAEKGIQSINQTALDLISYIDKECAVDECIIVLGGDIIDGDTIYPGQSAEIETPAFLQVKGVVNPLWDLAKSIANSFPEIKQIRFECCHGNHGRSAPAKQQTARINNWDLVVYDALWRIANTLHTENLYNNINVYYSLSEMHTFMVKGWKWLIKHTCARYLETKTGEADISKLQKRFGFDAATFFHWHRSAKLDIVTIPVFRNGSPVGPNEFSDSHSMVSKPCMWMIGVTENHLPSFLYEIEFPPIGEEDSKKA